MSGVIKERRSLDLIIQEICMTCISQGLNTSEAMAKYAVSIVTLDPMFTDHKFKGPKTSLIFHITELAIKYLLSMQGIKLKLLFLQAYYAEDFKNEEHVVDHHRRLLNMYAEPLLKHVILYNRVHSDNAMVLRHIVLLTIIMTGMGDPTNSLIYKEAEAAVTSVMSAKDVIKFVHLSQFKKRRQLQEVIKLVTGIRIYNRARSEIPSKEDHDDIDDLPRLLVTSISQMQILIEKSLSETIASVSNLERALEECFEWDMKSANLLNYTKVFSLDEEEYDFAKNLLCLWQQFVLILRSMLKNITDNLYEQLKSEDQMRSKILVMMDKLSCKVGVPSKEVFPDFLELFQHWKGFQSRLVLVNEYNKMLKKMKEYCNVPVMPLTVQRAVEDEYWLPDESIQISLEPSNSIEVFHFEEVSSSPNIEFGGFCPVWLTLTDGILLTVNKDIGVLKYVDKYYAFRDHKAAKVFSHSPDTIIAKVFNFGRQNPEFIDILRLRNGLKTRGWGTGGWTRNRRHFKRDKLVQTEIHPIREDFQYKYRHSVWQMKKDACQLADLRHKKTHGVQTRLSHSTRWATSQTYEDKENGCQTVKDRSTNVPTLQNFIFGLRGHREEVQHLVTLTRPVEEGPREVLNEEVPIDVCRDRNCQRFNKCDCHCKCYGCQLDDSQGCSRANTDKNL